jgi:hypothetical protein
VVYYATASAVATAVLLVGLGVIALWIPQLLGRRPRAGVNGLAVLAALAAGAVACWGTLPQVLAPYRHLDRTALNGRVYQLGLRVAPGVEAGTAEAFFVLCACDASGLTCVCRDAAPTTADEITAVPELMADPARNSLRVQIGERVVLEQEVAP